MFPRCSSEEPYADQSPCRCPCRHATTVALHTPDSDNESPCRERASKCVGNCVATLTAIRNHPDAVSPSPRTLHETQTRSRGRGRAQDAADPAQGTNRHRWLCRPSHGSTPGAQVRRCPITAILVLPTHQSPNLPSEDSAHQSTDSSAPKTSHKQRK